MGNIISLEEYRKLNKKELVDSTVYTIEEDKINLKFSMCMIDNYLYIISNQDKVVGITITYDGNLAADMLNEYHLTFQDGTMIFSTNGLFYTTLRTDKYLVNIYITEQGDIIYDSNGSNKSYAFIYNETGFVDMRYNKNNLYMTKPFHNKCIIKNPNGISIQISKDNELINIENVNNINRNWSSKDKCLTNFNESLVYRYDNIKTHKLYSETVINREELSIMHDDYKGYITDILISPNGDIYEKTTNDYGLLLMCRKLYELKNNEFCKIGVIKSDISKLELRKSFVTNTYGVCIKNKYNEILGLTVFYMDNGKLQIHSLDDYYSLDKDSRYKLKSVMSVYSNVMRTHNLNAYSAYDLLNKFYTFKLDGLIDIYYNLYGNVHIENIDLLI